MAVKTEWVGVGDYVTFMSRYTEDMIMIIIQYKGGNDRAEEVSGRGNAHGGGWGGESYTHLYEPLQRCGSATKSIKVSTRQQVTSATGD